MPIPPTLIIFSGLSATGKTTIARELARQLGATYLRADSIEQVLRESEAVTQPINELGYCVAYALAEENLRLGNTVVADSVNPLAITRDAWVSVAHRAQVRPVEIEIQCSDAIQHRRRVEERTTDIPGLSLPTWDDVTSREYHPWYREHIVLDGHMLGRGVSQPDSEKAPSALTNENPNHVASDAFVRGHSPLPGGPMCPALRDPWARSVCDPNHTPK